MTKRMSLLTPAVTGTNERERMGRNESVLSCAPLRLLREKLWWLAACLLLRQDGLGWLGRTVAHAANRCAVGTSVMVNLRRPREG